jgi:hypothetical protein
VKRLDDRQDNDTDDGSPSDGPEYRRKRRDMRRHDLDLFSLMSGLLFASLALVFALNSVSTLNLDLGVVPAVVFIVFGLAISASVLSSTRARSAPEPIWVPTPPPIPTPTPVPDSTAHPAAESVRETDLESDS